MGEILRRGGTSGLGVAGGLTLIKSAAAFTQPRFATRGSHQRVGHTVEHFVVVEPTTAGAATHESFYPAPGDHLRPGMTQRIAGRLVNHYWRITPQISDLIRRGEQEHLDDAQRAYDLTYGAVERAINRLSGRRFGPASSPAAAERLALAALGAALPHELGTGPANWVRVLDRLLLQTQARDTNGWHALSIDPPITENDRIIHPVATTGTTQIGREPPSQVVNY
jgi:hypothetical protein